VPVPTAVLEVLFVIALVPTALVPLPINNWPDVNVVAPVPPLLTGIVALICDGAIEISWNDALILPFVSDNADNVFPAPKPVILETSNASIAAHTALEVGIVLSVELLVGVAVVNDLPLSATV